MVFLENLSRQALNCLASLYTRLLLTLADDLRTFVDVTFRAPDSATSLRTASFGRAGDNTERVFNAHIASWALYHTAGSVAAGVGTIGSDARQVLLLDQANGALKSAAARLATFERAIPNHIPGVVDGILDCGASE